MLTMELIAQEKGKEWDASDLAHAFAHSITWEDDIWRADPVDVVEIHQNARLKFEETLRVVRSNDEDLSQARILLFHGQSGAGKTHLLRALRTSSHREGSAYFGYAQMSADISNYADYFLRRLIHSLEKPYDPDNPNESALTRLTTRMVSNADLLPLQDLLDLRESPLDENELAKLVLRLADAIVASPKFSEQEIDINIVRALLYLERRDPHIEQRIRQYLNGRELTPLSHKAVGALDPNSGEDHSFEIINSLGKLIWAVEGSALVFAIDQVEDLRFFDNAEERFQKAIRDLIQITNRLKNGIIIISCLDDFYSLVRGRLTQSYIDRIEKSGPELLLESRTVEEARLIICKRLQHEAVSINKDIAFPDPAQLLGSDFFEQFRGLSTRRLLEYAQTRLQSQKTGGMQGDSYIDDWASRLACALGGVIWDPSARALSNNESRIDYRESWERFHSSCEAEIPSDDGELLNIMTSSLSLAKDEWGGDIILTVSKPNLAEDVSAIDLTILHKKGGIRTEARVFLCNRKTQGGAFKRQLDSVLTFVEHGKACFMIRASDFPPSGKNQTALALRKFRDAGGRLLVVSLSDWDRIISIREFFGHHRLDPGFSSWFQNSKLLSKIPVFIQLLRLDLLLPPALPSKKNMELHDVNSRKNPDQQFHANINSVYSDDTHSLFGRVAEVSDENDSLFPDSSDDSSNGSIFVGWENSAKSRPISLNLDILKRHSAVLGGSGSGKTTLALCVIEQLLLQGIPAVLIDRKGDLCSYANPDVWINTDGEIADRHQDLQRLFNSIDVAVYTPGRSSGRPISITLLPNGINELPEHEQQLLANLSAAALGEMLHLKNSATHQKQSGTLSVALRILGSRYSREVMLSDLIALLEDDDPELTDITQRMDPSGKIRRDLVAQLDSLRHRNAALFEGGGESLRMESLLGLGPYAREGRTRLSVIYTGFLGDNENILFWVSQFLAEALRFCQRNPNDELQAIVMLDESDLYIPANSKPATSEPLQSLLKRARSAGLGLMLATQSPGDLDYKSRDQITSWFIGRVREDTALRKLKAAFQSESGLDPASVLPGQTVGEFHLVQEGKLRPIKSQRSLIQAEQVPFDRIEQLALETKGQDQNQLRLFDQK
ncbi:MAG: ATP-binding protein [Hyphomicrobium sp.]